MATIYGNNSSTDNPYYRLWMEVTEGTYSIENNTSPVTVKLYMQRTTGSWAENGGSYNGRIYVGSQYKDYSGTLPYPSAFNEGQSRLYATLTFDAVPHESDGSKTVTVTANYSATFSPRSGSLSGDVVLATIPRASKLKSDTTYWKTTNRFDSGVTVGIQRYADSFYHKLVVQYLNVSSQSYSTIKTINNIEDGGSVTFTASELNTMYSASIPNTTETIKLLLYTYSNSGLTTQVGSVSELSLTGALTTVAPTFTDFNYSDTNGTTTNLTKDSATIVKGYSTLRVAIPTSKRATANTRQTSMSHYIVNGETLAYSTSAEVSKSFSKYNSDNISVYAVDARGTSSNVVNKSFTSLNKYINYSAVTKNDNQSYSRSDGGVGEFVTISFSGAWWGNRKFSTNSSAITNALTATYKYRVSGVSTWTTPSNPNLTLNLTKAQSSDTYYTRYSFNNTVNGDLSTNGFDVSKSYDIMVTVQDRLSSVTFEFSIHSGEPAIALYGNKAALGAKYDQSLGGTQLWGDAYLNGQLIVLSDIDKVYPVGSIYMSVNSTNPNTLFGGTWERIKDRFLLSAGDTYSAGSNGGAATVTLKTSEIPSHSHWEKFISGDGRSNNYVRAAGTGSEQGVYYANQTAWVQSTGEPVYTNSAGGGQAHENMPPYLVVYVWKRIA